MRKQNNKIPLSHRPVLWMHRIVCPLELNDIVLRVWQRRRIRLGSTHRQPLLLGGTIVATTHGLLLLETIRADALQLDAVAARRTSLMTRKSLRGAIVFDDAYLSGNIVFDLVDCLLFRHCVDGEKESLLAVAWSRYGEMKVEGWKKDVQTTMARDSKLLYPHTKHPNSVRGVVCSGRDGTSVIHFFRAYILWPFDVQPSDPHGSSSHGDSLALNDKTHIRSEPAGSPRLFLVSGSPYHRGPMPGVHRVLALADSHCEGTCNQPPTNIHVLSFLCPKDAILAISLAMDDAILAISISGMPVNPPVPPV